MAAVLVYIPGADGQADKVALQALALGTQIAAGGPVHAIVIGDEAPAESALEMVKLVVPEGQGKQAEILGEGPDAAPAVVELLSRLGVM